MGKLNTLYSSTRVKMLNGRIRSAIIVSRTDANNVMVRIHRKQTPFAATMQTRTRNGRVTKILAQV